MNKKYTTLLLDSDDTLLDFQKAEHYALTQSFAKKNFFIDDAVRETYKEINTACWRLFEEGVQSKEAITILRFQRLFETLGISQNPEQFNQLYLDCLSEAGILLPGSMAVCEQLSKTHSLYIITNGVARVQKSRIEKSGILPFFSGVFISEQIGIGKPDLRYFDHVYSAIPEKDRRKMLVVGDSLTSDIRGGINAGMDTCWISHGKKLFSPATYTIPAITALPELLLHA